MIHRQRWENSIECPAIVFSHIGGCQHPGQQTGNSLVVQPLQNGGKILIRGIRSQATQGIVCAQLDDGQVRGISHGPDQAGKTASRCIPGNAGVDHNGVNTVRRQRHLQSSRERIVGVQAIARGQAVPQHNDGHGFGTTRISKAVLTVRAKTLYARSPLTPLTLIVCMMSSMPPAPKPLVQIRGVALTLESAAGAVNILRGVDLEVAPSETLAITGPSGSGKSTLLAVMTGLERPSEGTITVAGLDLGTMDEDALALFRRDTIGIVFQSFYLIPTMTALENVAVPLELAGNKDAFTIAAAGLEAAGLGPRMGHYPSQMSGGEQQRVAVARAFAGAPALVIADEPTGNLDTTTGAAIVELMFSIQASQQTSLVLITHDPAIAERCDRVVHMRDGRVFTTTAVD